MGLHLLPSHMCETPWHSQAAQHSARQHHWDAATTETQHHTLQQTPPGCDAPAPPALWLQPLGDPPALRRPAGSAWAQHLQQQPADCLVLQMVYWLGLLQVALHPQRALLPLRTSLQAPLQGCCCLQQTYSRCCQALPQLPAHLGCLSQKHLQLAQ